MPPIFQTTSARELSTQPLPRPAMMENVFFGDNRSSLDQRCAAIAACGFHALYLVGYPLSSRRVDELLASPAAAHQHGLEVSGLYLSLDLSQSMDAVETTGITTLLSAIESVPRIEISVQNRTALLACEALDRAADGLQPLLEIARRRHLRVSLYPHASYAMETLENCTRLQHRLQAQAPGLVFPLSHIFACQPDHHPALTLEAWLPRINSFNLCGCRLLSRTDKTVQNLPLDEGDLALDPLIQVLRQAAHPPALTIQGYGWPGDPCAGMRRSLQWWQSRTGCPSSTSPTPS